jgi:hypothetical protein
MNDKLPVRSKYGPKTNSMVILVLSRRSAFEVRQAIRETWGKVHPPRALPRSSAVCDVRACRRILSEAACTQLSSTTCLRCDAW